MNHLIGSKVFTLGNSYWTRMQWGVIVKVPDANHYVVKYADDRKAWIRKELVLFWS